MRHFARFPLAAVISAAIALAALVPASVHAQSFALDPSSRTLTILGIGPSNVVIPGAPAGPGPLPPPAIGLKNTDLGLLPTDAIDAISFSDDAAPGTIYFTVSRAAVGAAGPTTPHVASEVAGVPPGTQPDASSDIFSSFDPVGAPPGFDTQVLDGNGLAPLAPLTAYAGFGLGLSELNPLPGPPLNDAIADFDWAFPGRARLFGSVIFSLAPGSPTLVPGSNPNFPAGAEPGDLLFTFLGPPKFHGISVPQPSTGSSREVRGAPRPPATTSTPSRSAARRSSRWPPARLRCRSSPAERATC